MAALVIMNKMNATAVLLAAGLLYIAAGLYFRVPVPVQPFKAVAAIAIALGLAQPVISASGIIMGVLLALIALTPLAGYLGKIFSKPVVRGIQFTIGLFLINTGFTLLTKNQFFIGRPLSLLAHGLNMNYVVAALAAALLIVFQKNRRIPASLAVLGFGAIIGIAVGGLNQLGAIRIGPEPINLTMPSFNDFYLALTLLVVAQLPTTLTNSIIATNDVAKVYFGDRAKKVTTRSLLASVSAANLCFGFFGAMPMCHGAGGMTAHYKFGSRTGGSNLIIGGIFVTLALAFGRYAIAFLALIPAPVYAILLFYLGLQHALLIQDLVKKRNYVVTIGMGALAAATHNLLLAIFFGYFLDMLLGRIPASNAKAA
jgi:SulP family sulfate permease